MKGPLRIVGGEPLCNAHRKTGCPTKHVPGCARCEEAKSRGIVRPTEVKRGFIDVDKAKRMKALRAQYMAENFTGRRT